MIPSGGARHMDFFEATYYETVCWDNRGKTKRERYFDATRIFDSRSRYKMRRDDAEEFPGRDHLRLLPKPRKMSRIADHQIVGAGSVGALQEHVVVRVRRHLKPSCRHHSMGSALDELEELLPESLADFQFPAGEHLAVLGKDGIRNVELGGSGGRQQEDGVLQAVRFQCCRND